MPPFFSSRKRTQSDLAAPTSSSLTITPPRAPARLGKGITGDGVVGRTDTAAPTIRPELKGARAGDPGSDGSADSDLHGGPPAFRHRMSAGQWADRQAELDGGLRSPEEIQISMRSAAGGAGGGGLTSSVSMPAGFSPGKPTRIGGRRLSQRGLAAANESKVETLAVPPPPANGAGGKGAKMLGLDVDDDAPQTARPKGRPPPLVTRRSTDGRSTHARTDSSGSGSNMATPTATPTRANFNGGRITPPPPPATLLAMRNQQVGLSPTSTFARTDYFSPSSQRGNRPQQTPLPIGRFPSSSNLKTPLAHPATGGITPTASRPNGDASSMPQSWNRGSSFGNDAISPGTEVPPPTFGSGSLGPNGAQPAQQSGKQFAPAAAWSLGDGPATTPLGRGIEDQARPGKKPSAEISPFLFQGEEDYGTTAPPVTPGGRRQVSLATDTVTRSSSNNKLRNSRSAGALRHQSAPEVAHAASPDPGSPAKKRSFLGLLKKKASRTELNDGEGSESKAKKQAASWNAFVDGSGADNMPGSSGKRGRMKKLGGTKDKPRPDREGSMTSERRLNSYGLDQDIALDTNLDSMEGIIDMNSQYIARRDSSISGSSSHKEGGSPIQGASGAGGATLFVDPFNNGRKLPANRVNQLGSPETDVRRQYSGSRKGSVAAQGAALGPLKDFRRGSYLSIHSTSSASGNEGPGSGRRPSLAGASVTLMQQSQQPDPAVLRRQGGLTHVSGTTVAGAPAPATIGIGITAASGSAAWTAPESWAVKGDGSPQNEADGDTSDDEAEELENVKPAHPAGAQRPPQSLGAIVEADGSAKRGRLQSETGASMSTTDMTDSVLLNQKPVGYQRRPGTGTKVSPADIAKTWTLRIYRPDGSFMTLISPLLSTTDMVYAQLAKKLPTTKSSHSLQLLVRERGLERVMANSDKPLIIQRRRLEQAGWNESDKLDDVGRNDYSYLIKFCYREASLTTSLVDRDEFDSYDYVNLQARSLQAVPIFLFKHANAIVGLNLSRNPKLDVPSDFIALCTHLRELRLCYMAMKRVPQSVSQCPSLTYLDVSNNRIVDLENSSLDRLNMLTDLKAHNNRLYSLPAYFGKLSSLRFLNISNNKFDTLPEVLCEATSLNDLDISFNMISSLPDSIGRLVSLERLVLLANPISTLPATFSDLRKLQELDCRRCMLGDIAILSKLPELKTLQCDHNNATILDGEFRNLQMLTACRNSLTRLKLTGTKSTLVSLNVSHAKISSLGPEFFDALGACETLILDNNQIKSLSDGFAQLTNLRKLSIRNNHLTSLPSSIGLLQRLHTLDLANNSLASLPNTIWNCAQLIVLNVTSNLISEFPLPQVQEQSLPDDFGRKMSVWSKATSMGRVVPPMSDSLQELFMGDNKLGDDVFSPLSLLSELRVLNLSFNDLYEIPALTLSKCESLEELYLSGNGLSSLPGEDFEKLANLKTLFVNSNKLQTIPAELGKIKHLEALDVSSNMLKYNVTNWPYDWNWNWNLELQYLNFSGNKRLEIKPASGNQQDAVAAAKRRNLSNFNALRKLRMLGLMDVTLTTTSLPDENDDRRVRSTQSEIGSMGYGIADSMGREDQNVTGLDMVIPRFRNKDDESLFGLFDAHAKSPFGGAPLAKYLQDNFAGVLSIELRRVREGEGVPEALRRAFLNVNRDYGNSICHLFDGRRKGSDASTWMADRSGPGANGDVRCGASAVIVYVHRKTVHVANVGDALAVIAGRGGTAKPLSFKHDPFDAQEIERIRTSEGWVSQKGLISDDVEVSRSFGYYHLHPAINARPSVQSVALTEDDEFIIVANASLWTHMTYQAAVDVARNVVQDASLLAAGDPFMLAAQKLRDLALSYGAESNLMVMVIGVGDLFKAKRHPTYRGAGGVLVDEDAYGATRVAARRGQVSDAPAEKYLTLLDREVAPPTGMVALVFTDIRNSTSLWESNGGMQSAMRMHNQLLRRQLRAIGGYEVKTEGDAFMVSFPTVTSALLWCFTVQLELLREDWPQEILDGEDGKEIFDSLGQLCYRGLSVRMGLHWGNPHCETDPITRRMDYFGPMVNRSARISAEAKGGEIAASLDVVEIIKKLCFDKGEGNDDGEDPEKEEPDLDPAMRRDVAAIRKLGFGIFEIGERRLKGLETPETLSLIYPRALAGRLNCYGASLGGPDGKVDEVYEPAPRLLDVDHIRQLAVLIMRLEAVSAATTHPPLTFDSNLSASPAAVRSRLHPHLLAYPIRLDSTDEDLTAVLENQVIRLENVLASLQIHALGPIADILSALGSAFRPEHRRILQAMCRPLPSALESS